MSEQKAQIIGELQRKGKRITGQRKILLDVILEGNWSSCKEIYYMASKKDPTIGLGDCLQNGRRIRGNGIFKQRIQIFLSSGK